MSSTNIASGSSQARKLYSVGLFSATQQSPGEFNNMSGPLPQQNDAESNLRVQSAAGMPVVKCGDLTKTRGEKVTFDLTQDTGGKPIMGDAPAQGKGDPLKFSTLEVKIDQTRKPVDLGGEMSQQRIEWNLRGLGMANLAGYMYHLESQRGFVHLAGARGTFVDQRWKVPLSTDADFTSIMVNSVKAPSYNRHFVVNGTALTQGGLQVASIASTDVFKLDHIDAIATVLAENAYTLPHIRIEDDPAKDDAPMWLLLLPPRVMTNLLTQSAGLRDYQKYAFQRASYGSKSPLFKGDAYMWRNILIRQMPVTIRHDSAGSYQYVAVANKATGTETAGTVATIAGYAVDRALLLGAQALGIAYGKNTKTGYYASIEEQDSDFGNRKELCAVTMTGLAKIRFDYPDGAGATEVTDHGVIAIDSAVKL